LHPASTLLKISSFCFDDKEQRLQQSWIDRLNEKKLTWDAFLLKAGDLLAISRLVANANERTLLHLAVLDNRLDVVQILKRDSSLKAKRDRYGLSAIELARLLDRKECLQLLQPLSEVAAFPDLPPLSGFQYLSYPIFETKEGLEQVIAQTAKAKLEDKIPAEKIWMGIYFDKELSRGIHPPISIRYIDPEVGYGVFSEKKIPSCTYAGEFTGTVQERKPKELKDKYHCLRYAAWEGRKNFCIDAEQKGNFTRFINHSAKPNLGLQSIYWRGIPRMIFVTLKEIRAGAQLTFDYGPFFWKEFSKPPQLIE
jgi:hypothetical protein